MSVNVNPITGLVAGQININVVARYPNCCQGTGRRNHTTKSEEWLHAVPFGFSALDLATGVSGTAGTPFASAAWKVSGVMPNRSILFGQVSKYPAFPKTISNCCLLGRPAIWCNRKPSFILALASSLRIPGLDGVAGAAGAAAATDC